MDRQPRLTIKAALVGLALAGCGGGAGRIALPADARVLARGSLAYAVAFAPGDRVVSIELEERFALVVRSADGRAQGRYDLGPAERDLGALAVAGADEVAWVGGADRRVRGLGLADGRAVATWSTGAVVTALAAADGLLLVGDAEGGVCLRRTLDGALLQCLQLADRPVEELLIVDGRVVAVAAGQPVGLTLPALALVEPPADSRGAARHGRELRRGARVLRFGGVVKAFAVDERGRLAVAAWIAQLDDPSLVIVGP